MINTQKVFIRNFSSKAIQDFFTKTLDAFGEELNRLASQMYKYPNGKKGIDNHESINDVFALIERSYIGLLNNAVVRSFPKNSTLHEFIVSGKKQGERADYLVTHHFDDQSINFLFEGKISEATYKDYENYDPQVAAQYYKQIHDQACKYFEAEKEYYQNETYIVTIIFEWIRKTDLLDGIRKELKEYEKDDSV